MNDDADIERLRAENLKLYKINQVLMTRVERSTDWQGNAFSLFQSAIVLEGRVEERTFQLEAALRQLETVNHDVSRAKEAAETAQQRLSEAIESISEGFALFDADDRLVLWNANYVNLIAVLGQDVAVGTRFARVIHTAVKKGAIRDAIGREEAWTAERLAYHLYPERPFVYRLTDGRWVQVNERRTAEGGTVAVYTDITDIKLREEQRRQRELAQKSELLQATLESLSQGVAVFDRELRLVAWNQRYFDLHRFPPELAREGMPYAEFLRCNAERGEYGSGAVDELVGSRVEAARQGHTRFFERTLADGRIVEVASNAMPGGGFVNTYTDITERKRADLKLRESERRLKQAAGELRAANEGLERRVEQRTAELRAVNDALQGAKVEAEQANISKTKFLAAASHDLHQPLNAARLFVAALAERSHWPREDRDLLEGVDNALDAIDGLLTALFDISKLDAGVMHAEPVDVPVGPLLAQLAREYQPQARHLGLDLRVVPCSLVVRSDPRLLARILRNFLSNAIRYTERGRIILGCRRSGSGLRIQVWDTGIGIPTGQIPEVFQEFQQIALPGRRREKGMGLGLAIVERIARLLKHPLSVQSVVGLGSMFAIEMPICADAPELTQPHALPVPAQSRGSLAGVKVVAIDDDPSGIEAISALLDAWRCRVVAIRSSAELEAWLAEGGKAEPHLVVADYHLGDGSNGPLLVERLRAHFGAMVPAFIVTSDRDPGVRAAIKAQGLQVLNKPIAPAKLRALMTHMLAR